jgi:metal-responsive CopG/Arc/MetJ family transcriptional regulator
MAKEKFGVTVDEEIVREVDELVAECDNLGVNRSEIVEAILTAFAQPETNHVEQEEKSLFENERALSDHF